MLGRGRRWCVCDCPGQSSKLHIEGERLMVGEGNGSGDSLQG